MVCFNCINGEIRVQEVCLIGLEGEQFGIVSLREVLEKVEEVGVDLVEISFNVELLVCCIMDYGKFFYEKSKFFKEQKKK